MNDADECAAVMRAANLEPLVPYPGRHKAWLCRCLNCGSQVSPHFGKVVSGGGCRFCAVARNTGPRLDDAAAIRLMRDNGVEPLEPFPGAGKPWRCRCVTCGLEGSPVYNNVRRQGGACGHCRISNSAVGRVTAKAPQASEAMRAAGFEPLEPYPGRFKRWRCRCNKCGDNVDLLPSSVYQGGGCPTCSVGGFKPNDDAFVYLLAHDALDALKVGIANLDSGRLTKHRRRGWAVVGSVEMVGSTARMVEREVLRWWREELQLPPHLSDGDGWTETVCASLVSAQATMERIHLTHQQIGLR